VDIRLGIDVGGTFTDFVLLSPDGVTVHKRASTPADPLVAVQEGIGWLGLGADTPVVHGTTIVTNAVLQARGARTAFVTTRGFADILEIGRQDRPSLYDLRARPPSPLAAPGLRLEIDERVTADGNVLRAPDSEEIDSLADRLATKGAEAVAICFLFSFLRPEHERQVAARLRQRLPNVFISCSSDVAPEFREYERASTTVIDAFAGPLASGYLSRLRQATPNVQLMQSSGGLIAPEAAAQHPVCLALSGPAGGVAGAVAIAPRRAPHLITLDMGGTSTDVALCPGEIPMMAEGSLGGRPVRQPMVAVHTIGAGGGSIARLDAGGALRVGPESAGADPGPACYGRDSVPTVTDANLVLGRLDAGSFLGGAMPLFPERAREALATLGRPLGMDAEAVASGVVRVVNAAMARALAHVSVEQGHDPREFTLVPFGGAGPMHACELADSLGIRSVLVPRHPGVLSALGMTLADLVRDYRRSVLRPAAGTTDAELEALFAPLKEQARAEAAPGAQIIRTLDARYAGQSFELTVPVHVSVRAAIDAFHQAHLIRFGYNRPERPVELVTLRVRSLLPSVSQVPPMSTAPESRSVPRAGSMPSGRVWFPEGWQDAPLIDRERLATEDEIVGPALLVQPDATTVVASGWSGRIDDAGNLSLRRQ